MHFIESKQKEKFLSSPFSGKNHFLHNSRAVATIAQPTKKWRYTAGFISDNNSR